VVGWWGVGDCQWEGMLSLEREVDVVVGSWQLEDVGNVGIVKNCKEIS